VVCIARPAQDRSNALLQLRLCTGDDLGLSRTRREHTPHGAVIGDAEGTCEGRGATAVVPCIEHRLWVSGVELLEGSEWVGRIAQRGESTARVCHSSLLLPELERHLHEDG